ncbi:MAG: FkbM family methyltransferase [Lachnospiraceae bacterium]|nr:FkbM family methyltransferase [Lachnospiraceae bacterium]
MRFLLFGTGKIAGYVMEKIGDWREKIEIIGVIDNDETKQGNLFYGKSIVGPERIKDFQYDYICILADLCYKNIYNQLLYGYHIEKSKLVNRFFLLKQIMINKYIGSEDPDIQGTISYWDQNDISFFNQFEFTPVQYETVYWDTDNNMPYVLYANRRLYYPRGYKDFFVKDDKLCVASYRAMEQHEQSPHRYLNGGICIKENDIVVDAGAMEGDFALPFIDKIKKLYLFECDSEWVEALKFTYRDYQDKVVIINKMLSDKSGDMETTLEDSISGEKVDFIKMDIEGAEVKVLHASQKLLKENAVRCAICSYHRKNDRRDIEQILVQNGYQCRESNGHVVFLADPDIFKEADFRKGVVYAEKMCK